jgi:cation transport regulator ChaC
MSQTIADRVHIRLDTRVLRYGKGGSFIDELKTLKEQVAQLTLENEELRRFKAAVEAKAAADT